MSAEPTTPLGRAVNMIEESMIAIILGLMTAITFANVVARYVFNANILWALETTSFLFAWLVLLGASHCVKTRTHIGVDAVLNIVPRATRRALTLVSAGLCVAFSVLLLIGAWNYWAPFAALPDLTGAVKDQAWYEVEDIAMPDWLRFIEASMNQGEAYEKLPRFIPYFALPLGVLLITLRFVQATWKVLTGEADLIIASHEAEDLIEDLAEETAAEAATARAEDAPDAGPDPRPEDGAKGV
jgi:C4-dicarboxylate transporter DctQ subunit